ncbi:MAG: alpha/beta-type small acid-soluble spore protein [Firmicutes bacterium]|nr:alpha/beta-type small acid-soluble spore protein [Bacillota bacterium]
MAQFFPYPKLLPDSVLDRFKYEVAAELGLSPQIVNGYWGNVNAKNCGRVGGHIGGSMVRVMIRRAEEALSRGERL